MARCFRWVPAIFVALHKRRGRKLNRQSNGLRDERRPLDCRACWSIRRSAVAWLRGTKDLHRPRRGLPFHIQSLRGRWEYVDHCTPRSQLIQKRFEGRLCLRLVLLLAASNNLVAAILCNPISATCHQPHKRRSCNACLWGLLLGSRLRRVLGRIARRHLRVVQVGRRSAPFDP